MDNDGELRRVVADSGAFLRREALAVGHDGLSIARLVRSGHWVRVRHGAYTFSDLWPMDPIERYRLRTRAVLRTHGNRALPSHQSSALARDVDSWGLDLSQTHLTRIDGAPARPSKDVRYHEGTCSTADIAMVGGVPMTTMARAVLETCLVSSVEAGLVLADSALHKGLVSPEDLTRAFESISGWPGSQHVDLVLRLADGRAESVGESRSRYLMWSQGIPMPELQYQVRDQSGNVVAVTDFAWRRYGVVGEFDGRAKYGRYLRPGEEPGDAVFREKKREDLVRELTGWRVIRLVWSDLHSPLQTAARIRAMLNAAA